MRKILICLPVALAACGGGSDEAALSPYEADLAAYDALIDEIVTSGAPLATARPAPAGITTASYAGWVKLDRADGFGTPQVLAGDVAIDVNFAGGSAFGAYSDFRDEDGNTVVGTLDLSGTLESDGTIDMALVGSLDGVTYTGSGDPRFAGTEAEYVGGLIDGTYDASGGLGRRFSSEFIAER